MSLITRYKYLKIEEYTKSEDIQYITFHQNTKNIQTYQNIDFDLYIDTKGDILCDNEKVLIFDKEIYLENIIDTLKIQHSIQESSFSCHQTNKDNLIKFVKNKPTLNFETNKDIIIEEINKSLNNKTQSLKMYNNILKRLKYLCLCLFEKNNTIREENFKNGIEKRDKELQNKKYRKKQLQKWEDEDEKIKNSFNF